MNDSLRTIAKRILAAKRVLVLTHMRPDGDAYGSSLALACVLENCNIRYQVCDESDVPSNLTFLSGVEGIAKKPTGEFDLVVTLDCSDDERLGGLQEYFLAAKRKMDTVNIDHHISNTRFAKYNFVAECSANCMNVAKLLAELGAPLDKKTAEYLLVGLLTDSGNFSHDDVTEETLALAAKLVAAGANICHYTYQLFKKQPKARAELYAKTMSNIRYYHEDRFAAIVISQENMRACGADKGMTEGFVDFPLNVETVEVAAAILEMKKGQYKISLRSKKYADVNKIAGVYGGGGHVRAAGCMLFGEVEEVLDKLAYTVSQYLEE